MINETFEANYMELIEALQMKVIKWVSWPNNMKEPMDHAKIYKYQAIYGIDSVTNSPGIHG